MLTLELFELDVKIDVKLACSRYTVRFTHSTRTDTSLISLEFIVASPFYNINSKLQPIYSNIDLPALSTFQVLLRSTYPKY